MTYITENIIAMGFPAGDLSSGLFGYFEVKAPLISRNPHSFFGVSFINVLQTLYRDFIGIIWRK